MNDNAIFINCPFDEEYQPLLRALLFAALFYGLDIKIASMDSDSKSDRLKRIIEISPRICVSVFSSDFFVKSVLETNLS